MKNNLFVGYWEEEEEDFYWVIDSGCWYSSILFKKIKGFNI
jgi:hypothetical protein